MAGIHSAIFGSYAAAVATGGDAWVNQPNMSTAYPSLTDGFSNQRKAITCNSYSGLTYVVIGSGAGTRSIVYSNNDGVTFVPPSYANPITTSAWYAAAGNGGGMWVIGGQYGKVMYSYAANAWSDASTSLSNAGWPGGGSHIYGMTYGNGMFFAVGGFGYIATAPNSGSTWTVRTTNACNNNVCGIAYSGSLFVAVGAGFSATSTNGTSWTDIAGFLPITSQAVAYGNGLFVAVGGAGQACTSTDGVNWTLQPGAQAAWSSTHNAICIAYGGGRFYAGGTDSSTGVGGIISSADGVNWVNEAGSVMLQWAASTGASQGVCGITATPTKIIAIGAHGDIATKAI